jgi:hypothetical protein
MRRCGWQLSSLPGILREIAKHLLKLDEEVKKMTQWKVNKLSKDVFLEPITYPIFVIMDRKVAIHRRRIDVIFEDYEINQRVCMDRQKWKH